MTLFLFARRIVALDPVLDPQAGVVHGDGPYPLPASTLQPQLATQLLPGPAETRVRFRDPDRPRTPRGRSGRPTHRAPIFGNPMRGLYGPKDLR